MESQDMAEVVPLFGDRTSSASQTNVKVTLTNERLSDAKWHRLLSILFAEPAHDDAEAA